jgi:hypothetical protein
MISLQEMIEQKKDKNLDLKEHVKLQPGLKDNTLNQILKPSKDGFFISIF